MIFYITKDPERATGIEDLIEGYHIVCPYKSKLTDTLKERGVAMFVLEEQGQDDWESFAEKGSYGIMQAPCVKSYIEREAQGARPRILVLKTSELIEGWCEKQGWELWAPKAEIAAAFEEKITQYRHLQSFVPFPKTRIGALRELKEGTGAGEFPLILQFNAGHSGAGTHLVGSARELEAFGRRFPNRDVRLVEYISGESYTLNAFVSKNGNVYLGSISLQLTGLPEATNNPLSTVGNDFGAARQLSAEHAEEIESIALRVGMVMGKKGYWGLFGIDSIVEEKTGSVYLIEVNTHQPASIPFEAKVHRAAEKAPLFLMAIRDMMEGNGYVPEEELLPPLVLSGVAHQIVYRNKTDAPIAADKIAYPDEAPGLLATRMRRVKPNEELFRIQFYEQYSQADGDSKSRPFRH